MKRFLYLSIFLLLTSQAFAQPPQHQHRFERIHAIEVGYITERIHLTDQQAKRFWPVYDKYQKARWEIRKTYFQKYRELVKDNNEINNEDATRQYIDDNLDYQEQELSLKRDYKDDFLQILSASQLAELYRAEREFRQMLMERLREHHMDGGKEHYDPSSTGHHGNWHDRDNRDGDDRGSCG